MLLGAVAGTALLVAGAAFLILRLQALPSGPRPVVWDKTSCAECRMAVSEPPYAAQMQTRDGEVLDFDDAGCLFRFVRENDPEVHAVYFRHLREDRWVPMASVAFVSSGPSPMAYNLGAVDAGEPGAFALEEARDRVLAPRARSRNPAESETGAGGSASAMERAAHSEEEGSHGR
jgi:copper chaperone NosL